MISELKTLAIIGPRRRDIARGQRIDAVHIKSPNIVTSRSKFVKSIFKREQQKKAQEALRNYDTGFYR
jgi:hypothetical protein